MWDLSEWKMNQRREFDLKYAMTPFLRMVTEYHFECCKVLNEQHKQTWDYGQKFSLWQAVILRYSDKKFSYEIPIPANLPPGPVVSEEEQLSKIRYKSVVEKEIQLAFSNLPNPPECMPEEFELHFSLAPAQPVRPSGHSLTNMLSRVANGIWQRIIYFEFEGEEINDEDENSFLFWNGIQDAGTRGIYWVQINVPGRQAVCEIKRPSGEPEADERIKRMIEDYTFKETGPGSIEWGRTAWFNKWFKPKTLADKFDLSLCASNRGLGPLSLHFLPPDLLARLPPPIPSPPEDLTRYEECIELTSKQYKDDPDDLNLALAYSRYLMSYAGKAKKNETAKISWQKAANLSLKICEKSLMEFPDSAAAHFNMAERLSHYAELYDKVADHIDEVCRLYRRSCEIDKSFNHWSGRLAELYAKVGRYKEAIAELDSHPFRNEDSILLSAKYHVQIGEKAMVLAKIKEFEQLCYENDHDPTSPRYQIQLNTIRRMLAEQE